MNKLAKNAAQALMELRRVKQARSAKFVLGLFQEVCRLRMEKISRTYY